MILTNCVIAHGRTFARQIVVCSVTCLVLFSSKRTTQQSEMYCRHCHKSWYSLVCIRLINVITCPQRNTVTWFYYHHLVEITHNCKNGCRYHVGPPKRRASKGRRTGKNYEELRSVLSPYIFFTCVAVIVVVVNVVAFLRAQHHHNLNLFNFKSIQRV